MAMECRSVRSRGTGQATAHTCAVVGIEGRPAGVTARADHGANWDFVGWSDDAAKEARMHVRAALEKSGYSLPGHVHVERSSWSALPSRALDVPAALAILGAVGELPADTLGAWCVVGELSVTGIVRGVRGVFPVVRAAMASGFRGVLVPADNAAEALGAASFPCPGARAGFEVRVVPNLRNAADFLNGADSSCSLAVEARVPHRRKDVLRLEDLRVAPWVKRALACAAAGGHHLAMTGLLGSAHLARALCYLLPELPAEESIRTSCLHSVAGLFAPGQSRVTEAPFRAPHHTASAVGLFGGGDPPRPGECSLAHGGVLLVDDAPEFPRATIDGIRSALERREVAAGHGANATTFPADFLAVVRCAPCACGQRGKKPLCSCDDARVLRYHKRAASLTERCDLWVSLDPEDENDPAGDGPTTAEIRPLVARARAVSLARNGGSLNGDARGKGLATAAERIARTLADLDGSKGVLRKHEDEALFLSGGRV